MAPPRKPAASQEAEAESLRQALRRSEERYEQLLQSIDIIVWEADAETLKFHFVSQHAETVLGYPVSRWTEEPDFWQNHLHPDDRAWAVDFCQRSTEKRQAHTFDYRMLASDGRHVWIHDAVRFAVDPERGPILRGTMTDVTEYKTSEAQLKQSEERFQRFIETLDDVVYALDAEGTFVYCSPAIRHHSDYTPSEVVGRPFADFVDPRDLPSLFDEFANSLAGKPVKAEYRAVDKDGSSRWVRASFAPTIENGEVVGVTGVFGDISATREALEALHESESRYRGLVEMTPDAIVVHRGGKIVFANGAAQRLAGATDANPLVGRSPLDLVHESSRALAMERIRAMSEGGKAVEWAEEIFLRLDGTSIPVDTMASPIVLHGQPSILVVIHDATERKRAQAEIQLLNDDLERRVQDRTAELVVANQELEAFSYSVSHDLRAPLRVIEGFAKMFLDDYGNTLDGKGLEYMERIHTTSARMDRLIHDLLAFSRMSRATMHWSAVDLGALARTTLLRLREQDPDRQVEVVLAKDLRVRGDEQLLEIVVENLIENAWKYSSTRPDARLEFGVERVDGAPVYFVRDNGVGFDMRFLDKLFRPFQRLHAVGEFEGTGIGLATVRRIIERHGGNVWAVGEVGRGATVSFTLPPRRTAAQPA